jgi:hypothetical protein
MNVTLGVPRIKEIIHAAKNISTPVKLTVVLDYYEAIETYSRIGIRRSYGNLQSYWATTTKLWKLTVVLDYWKPWKLTVVFN